MPVNGSGSTTMTLGELPYKTTYFWRVKAQRRLERIRATRTPCSSRRWTHRPPPTAAGAALRVPTVRGDAVAVDRPSYGASTSFAAWRARTRALRTRVRIRAAAGSSWISVVDTRAHLRHAVARTASAATRCGPRTSSSQLVRCGEGRRRLRRHHGVTAAELLGYDRTGSTLGSNYGRAAAVRVPRF